MILRKKQQQQNVESQKSNATDTSGGMKNLMGGGGATNNKIMDVLRSSLTLQLEGALQQKLSKEFEDFYHMVTFEIEKRIGELEK